jgi:hypothetical protein
LILPIMKIPTLRQGNHSRYGRFSKLRNFWPIVELPSLAHVVGTGFIALPKLSPQAWNKTGVRH